MNNPSGISPTEYNVLVRPIEIEEMTKGGIILPEQVRDKEKMATLEGELIAVSPLAFSFDNWPEEARQPQVGDYVIFSRYAGSLATGSDGQEYRIMKDADISAIKQ